MQSTLKITARDFDLPAWLETEIRQKTAKLERYCKDIIDCEVAIEAPAAGHHQKGGPYKVRIDLQVKGAELAISNRTAENLKAAVRDAYEAAQRQIGDHSQRMQREVKARASIPIARVSRVFAENGYGFITTPEGEEIYFHRNSVLDGKFDRLEPGTEVRFDEEQGESGPQATSVKVVDGYTQVLHKL